MPTSGVRDEITSWETTAYIITLEGGRVWGRPLGMTRDMMWPIDRDAINNPTRNGLTLIDTLNLAAIKHQFCRLKIRGGFIQDATPVTVTGETDIIKLLEEAKRQAPLSCEDTEELIGRALKLVKGELPK